MPFKDTKKLNITQYQKSGKTSFIIYADLDSFVKKDGCKNILKNHLQHK